MRLAIIGRETVRRHLTFARCIPAIRQAMIDLSLGRTRQTLRQIVPIDDRGLFGVMQGALGAEAPFGAKILSVFPDNVRTGGQSHQGLVILFDRATGAPTHIVHAGEITAIRTAAASAVATDALARPDARRLAVLGTGEQARAHAAAICEVRPIERVVVWGRSTEKARLMASELEASLARPVTMAATPGEAVAGSDIICTTTAAPEPLLYDLDVPDGAHLNLVGSSYLGPREVDDALVARARFFADHRSSVLSQGAELRSAILAGLVGEDHLLAEIGDVLSGVALGRTSAREVTIYKSLGNIVQDLASAELVAALAERPTIGLDG
jgi:ornithine cyclodeaminase/alanine dehydrogenase-like protein (mu-crystallin family)